MAEVFLGTRADNPSLAVAIKVPLGTLPPEIDAEMFVREAEAAAAIDHPNVVKVVDWGANPPFIAFEYVEGRTLDRVISERQSTGSQFRLEELLVMFKALASALESVNEKLIHRDLKPANIFDTAAGPRVADLGLAKYVGEATRAKTFKGWGSLPYMAPESFRVESVDWRSDQYSLGVVFYEIATLKRPFQGDAAELERHHLYVRPARVTQERADLPESLATIVARMLEKRADDRFSSWMDLKKALADLADPSAAEMAGDPMVAAAVRQLEEVRAQELASRTAAEADLRQRKERQELLTYWADRHFDVLQSRIDAVNRGIGETAITYSRSDPSPRGVRNPTFNAAFLNARLSMALEAVPPDSGADFSLWGFINLRTNARGWFGNLILATDPEPYGRWIEVELEMNPIVRQQARPEQEDRSGGAYEILGSRRLVLAKNWQALKFQQEMRNVLSLVQYSEKDFDMTGVSLTLLEIMTEDGGRGSSR